MTAKLPEYITNPDSVFEGDFELKQKPNYANAEKTYLAGKTTKIEEGSLTYIVQQLVRALEKEASHKVKYTDWQTIDPEKFRWSTNHGKEYTAEEVAKCGSYNLLIGDSPFYKASELDWHTSHACFNKAFGKGFAWEVLEVFSGPPKVAFTWRHWGEHNGEFLGCPATGKTVELFGACIVNVSEDLKVEKVDFYLDNNEFLKQLTGGKVLHTQL